jgi:Ca2+-binding EF-hand superfamily protein
VIIDIKDAFAFFDPLNTGFITVSQLKTLLQYIAGGSYARKDLERVLKEIGDSPTVELKEAEKIAYGVWIDTGFEQEAKDVFRLFDKKDKGVTSMEEVKNVLHSRIDLPITDEDIEEIKCLLGAHHGNSITPNDFKQ